jgi:hypothetical protein
VSDFMAESYRVAEISTIYHVSSIFSEMFVDG